MLVDASASSTLAQAAISLLCGQHLTHAALCTNADFCGVILLNVGPPLLHPFNILNILRCAVL
jgi:hypothetical protein